MLPCAVPQITSRQHKKLIVVGNLNGQLADLLTIWQKHGLPHPEGTQYLFNGGVVNHGEHGMEVCPPFSPPYEPS